jgi:hypothetical protein
MPVFERGRLLCSARGERERGRNKTVGLNFLIHWLSRYLRQFSGAPRMPCLCSSVCDIFVSCGTEESSTVIFLGTKEYTTTEKCTMFSCSVTLLVNVGVVGSPSLSGHFISSRLR